jgi:hypothetical protein
MAMKARKNYTVAHQNLCDQYKLTKSAIEKMDFKDASLDAIKTQLLAYNMPKDNDMLIDLKSAQDSIGSATRLLHESVQKYNCSTSDDVPLQTETINARILSMLVDRFTSDLNRVIKDIRLECLEHDHDGALLKLIDKHDVDHKDDGNTLLMSATSQAQPPVKIISALLNLNADPFIKCRFDESPFSKAVSNNNIDLAKKYFHHKVDHLIPADKEVVLNALLQLEATSTSKAFYEELAHDLQDKAITSVLGLDQDCINTCLIHVGECYEALGLDSGLLYDMQEVY